MSNIVVSYNKNDFLYVSSMPIDCETDAKIRANLSCTRVITPSEPFLTDLCNCIIQGNTLSGNVSLDDTVSNCMINEKGYSEYLSWKTWQDNREGCYKTEVCKNKKNAEEIYKLQNDHLGSNQKYEDATKLYNNEYTKMFNLSLGIIGIIGIIFYTK